MQMVDRLAAYLDVPLRYPLALRGSRSAVIDSYPPAGTWCALCEDLSAALCCAVQRPAVLGLVGRWVCCCDALSNSH